MGKDVGLILIMANVQSGKRLIWVDQLKAFAMFLVVWGHCIQRCKTVFLLRLIYSFHMPLFFIISGLTFNTKRKDSITNFAKHKAKTILYPYFAFSIILIPLWLLNRSLGAVQNDSIIEIVMGIFYSNSGVIRATSNAGWFLVTLFFAEIIFYVAFKIYGRDHKKLFLISLLVAIIGFISPLGPEKMDAPFHLDVALVGQFFICVGMILKENLHIFNRYMARFGKFNLAILITILSAFFGYINNTVDISNEVYGNILYMLISSIGMSISLIYIFEHISALPIVPFIGKNTLIFLMVHVPILRLCQSVFPIIEHSRLYASITAVLLYASLIVMSFIIRRFCNFLVVYPFKRGTKK